MGEGRQRHHHKPRERRRLAATMAITAVMMVVEFAGGLWTGSLALVSDAGHMLTHFFALGVSFAAIWIAGQPSRGNPGFGYHRAEVLAALLNGVTLLGIAAAIVWHAADRIVHPSEIMGLEMLLIALAGLAVNVVSAIILQEVGRDDLNIRSAFLHMIGDAGSSVAVIVGAGVILATGWTIVDPVLSILVSVLILVWAVRLIAESVRILMEAGPTDIEAEHVAQAVLESYPDVRDVHELHLWVITSGRPALTAHVAVPDCTVSHTDRLGHEIRQMLERRFGIGHAILQFEAAPGPAIKAD